MTLQGFSDGFDYLANSYAHNAAFGEDTSILDFRIDEYEKSLFLTKAEEEVVVSLYTGRNSSLQGFEETEELRRYLSNLISSAELEKITNTGGKPLGNNSSFFSLPDGSTEGLPAVWFITFEEVRLSSDSNKNGCKAGQNLEVVPVRQDEYHRIKKNPFRGANSRRALRLDLSDNVVEIITRYDVDSYYIRYVRRPKPIILQDLDEGLEINGISTATDCELHEALHQRILELAVQMALQSRVLEQPPNQHKEMKSKR